MGIKAVERSAPFVLLPQHVPAKPMDRAKTAEEKRNTRDWILQYAQEDSGSEDGSNKVLFPTHLCLSQLLFCLAWRFKVWMRSEYLSELCVRNIYALLQQDSPHADSPAIYSGQRGEWELVRVKQSCNSRSAQAQLLLFTQGEEAIEDWEIWGDPREIERRKAERARAAIPPEQRKLQVHACSVMPIQEVVLPSPE